MQREIKANYPEIFKRCMETAGSFMHQFDTRSALEVSPEERMEQYEKLWAEPGFKKWLSNFYDVMMPGEANEDYAEFVRNKIRERVHDPEVAEMLVPKDHMFGSKRLPCESGYYEVYNQDNVLLVDVRKAPIERITPAGLKTIEAEYDLDVIIFATGYDAVTGSLTRIDIRGEGGTVFEGKVRRRSAHLHGHPECQLPESIHHQCRLGGQLRQGCRAVGGVGDGLHKLRA